MAELKTAIDTFSKVDIAKLSTDKRNQLNKKLMVAEQALTSETGLPKRGWFKHQIYAPGFYTGYGVKTLTSVRDAVEQKDWKEAQEQIEVLSETLKKFKTRIEEMNNML